MKVFAKVLKFLALVFFTYHTVAIFFFNYPSNTILGKKLQRPFHDYIYSTALFQGYDMFKGAHIWHTFTWSLIAEDPMGQKHRYGPLLPGLREIEGDGDLRVRVHFQRSLQKSRSKKILPAYAREACREIEELHKTAPKRVWVHFHGEKIRELKDIKKDGRIGEVVNILKGPYSCDAPKEQLPDA